MPVHVLHGDTFLVHEALGDFYTQTGPVEVREANTHHLSGAQATLAEVKAVCQAMPFLAEKRLLVVEGLLVLFEPRERRGRGSTSPHKDGPANSWEGLEEYLSLLPPTTLLVFKDGSLTPRNSLLSRLRSVAQITALPTPTGEELARWIKNRATAKGATLTPGAIRLLAQLVGSDLWSLNTELEKLSLFVSERPVEERDVRAVVSQVREASIFSAIDAVLEGRLPVALRLLRRLYRGGASFSYIISMIARQLRLTILAKDLLEEGVPRGEIAQRLSLSREFVVRKTLEQARRHPWRRLKGLYTRLLEADLAVKRGRQQEELMLELLTTQLSKDL